MRASNESLVLEIDQTKEANKGMFTQLFGKQIKAKNKKKIKNKQRLDKMISNSKIKDKKAKKKKQIGKYLFLFILL